MTWFVRHRPQGDTAAEATVVEVDTATSAEAIATVRATLPQDRVITSVAPY
jgi:hypothetical protein